MIKNIIISTILSFILLSCSDNYEKDVITIEQILNINLTKYEYRIDDSRHGIGFGKEFIAFNIIFSESDFQDLLNDLDGGDWDKIEEDSFKIYDYRMNIRNNGKNIWLFLQLDGKILKYSYSEDNYFET